MTEIKKSKEEVEREILDLSRELGKHEGSKAHGIRQRIQALHWVIGE